MYYTNFPVAFLIFMIFNINLMSPEAFYLGAKKSTNTKIVLVICLVLSVNTKDPVNLVKPEKM